MKSHSLKILVPLLLLLVSSLLKAQDCSTLVYLESQTVKSGDAVSFVGGSIISQPGKQFVVESNGNATLTAVKRIELNYGFKALSGAILQASMVPCDPGQPDEDHVVVYPNPTDGFFSVTSSYKIDAVRLIDMNGSVQLTKTDIGDTSVTLDISKLHAGYYLLEVIAGKTVSETVRIEKK
jgi:hypothetical protein